MYPLHDPESYPSKEKEQQDRDQEEGKATVKQKRDDHVDHSSPTVQVSCANVSLEATQATRCTRQSEPRLRFVGLGRTNERQSPVHQKERDMSSQQQQQLAFMANDQQPSVEVFPSSNVNPTATIPIFNTDAIDGTGYRRQSIQYRSHKRPCQQQKLPSVTLISHNRVHQIYHQQLSKCS